jgi:hypothetical protein
MKTNTASLSVIGIFTIAALLFFGILKIQHAYAQVDATSSDVVATTSTDMTPAAASSTSAANGPIADATTTDSSNSTSSLQASSPEATTSESAASTEPPPQGLTEVHIVGTKYVDYFTDGATTTSYPGDPKIDANLNQPDAPIPTHEGLTWLRTIGRNLYDTPSGDLEVGDYAVQSDGSYISSEPPFVSSTSTPEVLGASTSTSNEESASAESSSSAASPVVNSATTPPETSPATTADFTNTTAPSPTPVTNDSASDSSLAPADATTTDTPSI